MSDHPWDSGHETQHSWGSADLSACLWDRERRRQFFPTLAPPIPKPMRENARQRKEHIKNFKQMQALAAEFRSKSKTSQIKLLSKPLKLLAFYFCFTASVCRSPLAN